MKRLFFVFLMVYGIFSANADVSYLFSENSILNTPYVSKGLSSVGIALLGNPSAVAFSRNFEFTVQGVVMPYDRFAGSLSISTGLYKILGIQEIGSLGISLVLGGVSSIEVVDDNGFNLGNSSSFDYEIVFSYGSDIASIVSFPFAFGVNLKYFSSYFSSLVGSGFGVDFGVVFNPISNIKDLGFCVSLVNLYSLKSWNTGMFEVLPVSVSLGAFYYLFDDSLLLSFGINNTSRYEEVFSFRWFTAEMGISYSIDRNLGVKVLGRLGNEFVVAFGISYSFAVTSKASFLGWFDNIGFNTLGSLELYTGSPKYLAKVIDPEVQKVKEKERLAELEKENFSKAMMYFSSKDYRNAKKHLEEVLKINPNNDTAKAMIKKIDDILSLEEE